MAMKPWLLCLTAALSIVGAVADGLDGDRYCMLQHKDGKKGPEPDRDFSAWSTSASSEELAFMSGCRLGSSFDWQGPSCMSRARALDYMVDCEVQSSTACIETQTQRSGGSEHKKITDVSSYKKEMQAEVKAGGGGWGVEVSAGADYMASYAGASSAVTFFVRDRRDDHFTYVKGDPQLTEVALQLLTLNATRFVQRYGSHYVAQVYYAAEFLGTATVRETRTTDSSSLSAFAKLDVSRGFDLNFETNFNNIQEKAQSHTRVEINARSWGGKPLPPVQSLSDLDEKHLAWSGSLTAPEDFVPKRMLLKSFGALKQVQSYLNEHPEYAHLFNAEPSNSLKGGLGLETALTRGLIHNVEEMKELPCTVLGEKLNELHESLVAHRTELENLDFAALMKISKEITEDNNYAFFKANDDAGRNSGELVKFYESLYSMTQCRIAHKSEEYDWKEHSTTDLYFEDINVVARGLTIETQGDCYGFCAEDGAQVGRMSLVGADVAQMLVRNSTEPSEKGGAVQVAGLYEFNCPDDSFVYGLEVDFHGTCFCRCQKVGQVLVALRLKCTGLPQGRYDAGSQYPQYDYAVIVNDKPGECIFHPPVSTKTATCKENHFVTGITIQPAASSCYDDVCRDNGHIISQIQVRCRDIVHDFVREAT